MIVRTAEAKTVGWVYDRRFLDHDPGASHVERPERLEVIVRSLQQAGLLDQMDALPFSAATAEQLTLVHDPAYVDLVRMMCDDGFTFVGSSDTCIDAAAMKSRHWRPAECWRLVTRLWPDECGGPSAPSGRRGTMPKRIRRSASACSTTSRSPPNILFAVTNCRGWRLSISTCITATARSISSSPGGMCSTSVCTSARVRWSFPARARRTKSAAETDKATP